MFPSTLAEVYDKKLWKGITQLVGTNKSFQVYIKFSQINLKIIHSQNLTFTMIYTFLLFVQEMITFTCVFKIVTFRNK